MRLEEAVVETDSPLVERLRLGQFVAGVADVGQVDERRHQVGLVVQGAPVGASRLGLTLGRAVVEDRAVEERLLRARRPAAEPSSVTSAAADRAEGIDGGLRASAMIRAGSASSRKSNASCPSLPTCRSRRAARKATPRCSSPCSCRSRLEILERELRAPAAALRRRDEAPLLQVADVVFAKRRIHAEHVTRGRRGRRGQRRSGIARVGGHRSIQDGELMSPCQRIFSGPHRIRP